MPNFEEGSSIEQIGFASFGKGREAGLPAGDNIIDACAGKKRGTDAGIPDQQVKEGGFSGA